MKWKCKHCDAWENLPRCTNRPGYRVCNGPEKKDVFVLNGEELACPVAIIEKYYGCPKCGTITLKVSKESDFTCPNCGSAFCAI